MTKSRITISLLVLGQLILSTPALADSNGKFPGVGSLEAYNKAVDVCNAGVESAMRKKKPPDQKSLRNEYLSELSMRAIKVFHPKKPA